MANAILFVLSLLKSLRKQQTIITKIQEYALFAGVLQDCQVFVKRYRDFGGLLGKAITDIVIGSQMSAHNNVLKLLGCCLETTYPTIVYEFVGNKTLSKFIFDGHSPFLSWKQRIKITMGIANGVSYLHNALSRPVIYRSIIPASVIMDGEFNAKLIDFSHSIAIPYGQSHVVDRLMGTSGYLAPEYVNSLVATKKVDVYSFGVVLIQLLTGRRVRELSHRADKIKIFCFPDVFVQCMENGELLKIVDASILNEGMELQDLLPFATLALSCICMKAEGRPTMTYVARELKQVYQSVPVSFPNIINFRCES